MRRRLKSKSKWAELVNIGFTTCQTIIGWLNMNSGNKFISAYFAERKNELLSRKNLSIGPHKRKPNI